MRSIHKMFHEMSTTMFNKLHQERLSYPTTKKLGLHIKPMDQSNMYELYYVPTNSMIRFISELYTVSQEFNKLFEKLPKVAQQQFIIESISEELYHTNELEGIKSSKDEIIKSTKDIMFNKKSEKRFESMIRSYLGLLDNYEFPKIPADIRKIYNDITYGEIKKEELPDGDIFRTETTYILKKSGSGKIIHRGITPESEIITLTKRLLEFMNDNNGIPNIIKVAIGHYYFGYIHPFYDGNGRTSRFISSMYLSKDLENISTLSLSRGCNKYKSKYLDSFEITNSIKSRGEMNSFIEVFLGIVLEAQKEMRIELKEKTELLDLAMKKLENDQSLKQITKNQQQIMFMLAQYHFFNSSSGLTVAELVEMLEKSASTIRKMLQELCDLSLVDRTGKNPTYYSIRKTYFEE